MSAAKKGDAPIIAYKGFDADLKCRGFQYEVGGTYEHDGEVSACNSGFHACEYPLHVLRYYPPGTSRFAVVEQSGELSRHDGDSKIASSKITVQAEIGLPGLIKAAVEYTTSRAKPVKGGTAASDNAAATASGESGAATADHATAAAMASGYAGKASGVEGAALFLVERDCDYNIISAWGGIVGRDGIKPGKFYMPEGGKPVEVSS